ncbi:TlpA family protein disulfide reductase [Bacteriovoracaceae bacterium]|nr:TlpA family protein disulfide reductase [Bacteriovoracaceae bacterium]
MALKSLIFSALVLFTFAYIKYNKNKLDGLIAKPDQIESLKTMPLNYPLKSLVRDTKSNLGTTKSKKLKIVHFWATWCAPCEKEFPLFKDLFELLIKSKWDIYFVAINDDTKKIYRFLDKMSFPLNYIFTNNTNEHQTMFNVYKVPETLLFDANNNLIKRIVGPQSWNDPRMVNFFKQIEKRSLK